MDLFEDGIHEAFHHQTVGWRIKADENSNRIACVLIAYSRKDWTTNRESVEGIDDEYIEPTKVELPALVGSRCPGRLIARIIFWPAAFPAHAKFCQLFCIKGPDKTIDRSIAMGSKLLLRRSFFICFLDEASYFQEDIA